MDIIKGLDGWFHERLQSLPHRPETIAYVAGVMKALSRPGAGDDMSRQSIVLAYAAAKNSGDFAAFQRLGDWVLWVDCILPGAIVDEKALVESIGRLSYYTCNRMLRGQWIVYEELADELPNIAVHVQRFFV